MTLALVSLNIAILFVFFSPDFAIQRNTLSPLNFLSTDYEPRGIIDAKTMFLSTFLFPHITCLEYITIRKLGNAKGKANINLGLLRKCVSMRSYKKIANIY